MPTLETIRESPRTCDDRSLSPLFEKEVQPSFLTRLLLLCPCGGPRLLQRRTTATFRRARAQLARLQREIHASGDASAPLEAVRAASLQMAVVERWVRSGGGVAQGAPSQGEQMRRHLGVSLAPEDGEDDSFTMRFSPPSGEAIVKVLPCLVKSGDFRHPGKLFVSTSRVCFHSCVMGVEILFSVPWGEISQTRLLGGESTTTHRVRFTFRRDVDFDGAKVGRLDVRLFEVNALGALHRCATYFTGAGLFGLGFASAGSSVWQDDSLGVDDPEAPTPNASGSTLKRRSTSGVELDDCSDPRVRVQDMVAELERQVVVWELQRRTSIFHEDWRSPFLPHDGQKMMRWMTIGEEGYGTHPLLVRASVDMDDAAASSRPPVDEVELLGQSRPCSWHVVVDEEGDCDGWQYAIDFYMDVGAWAPTCGVFAHVRRRKWKPTFGAARAPDDADGAGGGADGGAQLLRRASASFPLPTKRLSTLMADKGLGDRLNEPLVEVVLGEVSLQEITRSLEADDWEDADGLMTAYFTAFGATELEIGPWASGRGAAAQVKGKVRSIEMRMPVPPQPMCPKETRCATTWHVMASDDKVVLESVTMSLDIPYGTSFNTIACDTFCIDADTGFTRMVRTWGVEWVQSTWLRGMIEAGVPEELAKIGHRWADVVREWAQARDARAAALDDPPPAYGQ